MEKQNRKSIIWFVIMLLVIAAEVLIFVSFHDILLRLLFGIPVAFILFLIGVAGDKYLDVIEAQQEILNLFDDDIEFEENGEKEVIEAEKVVE